MASIHMPDVYTDGLYFKEAPWEGFAGYGVWFGPYTLKTPIVS